MFRTHEWDLPRRWCPIVWFHIRGGYLPSLDVIPTRDYQRHQWLVKLRKYREFLALVDIVRSTMSSYALSFRILTSCTGKAHTTTINNQVRGRMDGRGHRSLRGSRVGKHRRKKNLRPCVSGHGILIRDDWAMNLWADQPTPPHPIHSAPHPSSQGAP